MVTRPRDILRFGDEAVLSFLDMTINRSSKVIDSRAFSIVFINSELDDIGLTPAEFRVYCHIARRAGNKTCWPGIDSIASVCQLSKTTVIRVLKVLEFSKMLTITRKSGCSTIYALTDKDSWCDSEAVKKLREEILTCSVEVTPNQSISGNGGSPVEVTDQSISGNERVSSEGNPNKEASAEEALPREVVFWNQHSGTLPKVLCMSSNRRKHLSTRRKEPFWMQHYEEAVKKVAASDFCNGNGGHGWRATFDWLIERPNSLLKVIEGQYDNRKGVDTRNGKPVENPTAIRIRLENDRERQEKILKDNTPQYDYEETLEKRQARRAAKARIMQIDGQLGAMAVA